MRENDVREAELKDGIKMVQAEELGRSEATPNATTELISPR